MTTPLFYNCYQDVLKLCNNQCGAGGALVISKTCDFRLRACEYSGHAATHAIGTSTQYAEDLHWMMNASSNACATAPKTQGVLTLRW